MSSSSNNPTTVRQVLVDALALIKRPHGWCKGEAFRKRKDGTMAYCAMQATCRVNTYDQVLIKSAQDALATQMGGDVVAFNDHSKRRKYQVVAAYKRAISNLTEE